MKEVFYSQKTLELVKKSVEKQSTTIRVNDREIGGNRLAIFAGPCSVESEAQILQIANHVNKEGGQFLRGGAFKPSTYPYRFQGLEEEGLKLLAKARERTGLPIVTEVMDTRDVELVYRYADILQIGARNMQNYKLLKEVGKTDKPIFLKKGTWATIDEFLGAAEYIMKEGNEQVILCERGIVSFEDHVRWTLSLSIVPALKERTHLPVIVDPSHGSGNRNYVIPLARAGIAVGADGLMIEVHPDPDKSVSDAAQTIDFDCFSKLMGEIKAIANIMGRSI